METGSTTYESIVWITEKPFLALQVFIYVEETNFGWHYYSVRIILHCVSVCGGEGYELISLKEDSMNINTVAYWFVFYANQATVDLKI